MKPVTLALRGLLVLAALMVLMPLVWTLLNAFKTNADLLVSTPKLIFSPVWENMDYVLGRRSVSRALVNSLVVCSYAVLLGAVLGVPAAYVIARMKNRVTQEAQFFALSLRFLPPVAVAIPMMVIWLGLDMYDSRPALIITYMTITVSITIWLSVPAFERVPIAIEEAARVDRLGPYAVFFRIALPVAKLQILSAIAFSFILVWNEFLLAMMLTTSRAKTLPIIASEMSQLGMSVPWGILNAAVVLLSLPPLILLALVGTGLNTAFSKKSSE
ncbi:sugar ABC transporter permease [Pacificitalea manganoxidans]|mgnify:CR=1 FL=1|uniref:Sugar ABC transporter permease n=1 Tax=Pacificitalea manganoxidans TaxID=1411902 RepID=A0A291LYX6_9RHOB|nr:carbohydrate ABC transporter permease [Pacificitalea manganoxidans]ATI41901.1 sugar ABC transporter permease [Pacificitalea manganoxidans]MAQ45356.1 carbohydrate ABC transporter permease [Actibacterium sp.]MDR6309384.1 multiple sugar transport system permease protein [Pacificitalea manganoxidans]OWU68225.1 sugar ABC transporter permease [Roseovarius sp. 22II1-1F6A]|tara:strand:+ start:1752 stop:2567 length:816 start_codon:yes stop_codon:yes gene_type:complete